MHYPTFYQAAETVLNYPSMLLTQACSFIASGAGKLREALLALKRDVTAIFYAPPPLQTALKQFSEVKQFSEELDLLEFDGLNLSEFDGKCFALIEKKNLEETEKSTLKRYYQRVLSILLDPAISNTSF